MTKPKSDQNGAPVKSPLKINEAHLHAMKVYTTGPTNQPTNLECSL